MGKRKYIDIMDIKQAIKNGIFRVYIAKGMYNGEYPKNVIYLKDMDTEEIIQIGVVEDGNDD
jgi:hypothetical protein